VEGSNRRQTQASIVVSARKYDGTEHRSWLARILVERGSLLILDAKFDEEVQHDFLGTISRGTVSTEYYWLDRWYNIFRFSDDAGRLRNYYCNVNLPPVFDGTVLSYVDLDIDVLVAPDYSYKILDFDDFAENAKRYSYSSEVIEKAETAVTELISLVESRAFPFDSWSTTNFHGFETT
jgi:uncharacterized protein